MARYGFGTLVISVDDSGGTPVDLSTYITSINGFEKEALLEEITSAGDDDQRWGVVGVSKVAPIVISGPFDDTASTGPHAVLNAIGNTTTRTFTITIGGSVVFNVETIINKYVVTPNRNGLTMFEATLQPTGAVS